MVVFEPRSPWLYGHIMLYLEPALSKYAALSICLLSKRKLIRSLCPHWYVGVFFVRRSKWSKDFLNHWWNQTSFIQFGSTKSGDNAAMKHLVNSLTAEELQDHVRISPMQCLFNSYPWNPTWKSAYRLISSPQTIWKG